MTDMEARRRACVLVPQLPATAPDRQRVLKHMIDLVRYLDGDVEIPLRSEAIKK